MDQTKAFDEAHVRSLLAGTEDDVGQALALIDLALRERLVRWLRRRFPGVPPDDLACAWLETLSGTGGPRVVVAHDHQHRTIPPSATAPSPLDSRATPPQDHAALPPAGPGRAR